MFNLKFKTMKKNLFFALIMLVAGFAAGQKQNVTEIEVTAPQFAGIKNVLNVQAEPGNSLRVFLMENIGYPEKAERCFKEGTEVVQFTVTASGNVTNFKIINSVCREIDDEVIWALIQTNGMWLPGYNNGKPVDMTKEVSLAFIAGNVSGRPTHAIFKEKAEHSFGAGNKNLFEKHNPKKALKNYSAGINYLPYDNSLLLMRGVCRYELGDKEGAREDWRRMATLGESIDMSEYYTQLEKFAGYNEMIATLKK
jgi:TonB family protein